MGDEEDVRARIEAQIASRRAGAPPSKRDWSGRKRQADDPAEAQVAPRSLGPVRPWLSGARASIDPGHPAEGVDSSDHTGSSSTRGPAQPWSARPINAAPPATDFAPAAEAPDRSLQPVRPWQRRTATPEPAASASAAVVAPAPEPNFNGPRAIVAPSEPRADDTSSPPPARVLQEHWARERETLITERAALVAERELLHAQRVALSDLRESAPAAETDAAPTVRQRGWFGRRRAAAIAAAGSTTDTEVLGPRHAATAGQAATVRPEPVSPFESFRARPVAELTVLEPSTDQRDVAVAAEDLDVPETIDEHIDVAGESDTADEQEARAGWSRRTLGWLLAPADQPEQQDEPERQDEPEVLEPAPVVASQGLPPWRLRPDVEPAAAPITEPEPEPEPVVTSQGLPPWRLRADVEPAAADDEPPALAPGMDMPSRLAAANAAAMARALATRAYDFPEDDDADADVAQRRRSPAAFVRPSDPRPSGIAREREPAAAAPLVTGTASARRNFPPAEVDDDEPGPAAPKRHGVTLRGAIRLLITLVVAAVIAVLLRTYVVAPYYIPSASMEPTLHGCRGCNNDHVLVDKLSYKMHSIHRGDVVVFQRPDAWQVSEKVLIKRVIGLPGDTLVARNGKVYINGLELAEPYVDTACQSGTTNLPKPVTVPDGEAFVMGDNRCDSSDSRRFGPIPDAKVVGRAFMIIWPFGRLHWL